MSRVRVPATLLAVAVYVLLLSPGAHAQEAERGVSVSVDRTRISTQLGDKVVFRSTVTNRGSTAASGLIAHLNVLSLRPGLYVDPEDWSSNRTKYLGPVPPGGSTTLTWQVQAVNTGELGVYVTVVPESGVAQAPATGPAIHVSVAGRRTLNAGGVVPLAVGIPGLLALLTLGFRVYRGGVAFRPAGGT
jgi:hypothetical protein